jgi:hypothetical protein
MHQIPILNSTNLDYDNYQFGYYIVLNSNFFQLTITLVQIIYVQIFNIYEFIYESDHSII